MGLLVYLTGSKRPGRAGGLFSRQGLAALSFAILIGGGIAGWARWELSSVLSIDQGARMSFAISDISGDCGTPSFYMISRDTEAGTVYQVLIDVLGGKNRFPDFGGKGTAAPVLSLPPQRRPGVGLGRALVETCEHMRFEIAGTFGTTRVGADLAGMAEMAKPGASSGVRLEENRTNRMVLRYDKPEEAGADIGLFAVTFTGIRDRWQYGYKRIAFENAGARALNIFLFEEDGYLFLNDTLSPIHPPGVKHAYADIHLEHAGMVNGDSADVIRKKPTSDLELQHHLVNISTVFGIGISLLIEGLLFFLLACARMLNQETPSGGETAATGGREAG